MRQLLYNIYESKEHLSGICVYSDDLSNSPPLHPALFSLLHTGAEVTIGRWRGGKLLALSLLVL